MRPSRPPMVAAIDETLTMAPPAPPRAVDIRRTASRQHSMVPITLTAISRSSGACSSSATGVAAAAVDPGAVDQRGEPAEARRRPRANMRTTWSCCATSACTAIAWPPARLDLGDQRLGGVRSPRVVDRDRVAPLRGEPRGRRADAAPAAGDQEDASHE